LPYREKKAQARNIFVKSFSIWPYRISVFPKRAEASPLIIVP
jgi:hypothetical protein